MIQSHIPSLEPQSRPPAPSSSLRRLWELLVGLGTVPFCLRVLDLFGKGEAAVDIYKLLPHIFQFIGNPVFSALAILAGFAGLTWQANRQAASQPIPTKQIVHPVTKLPVSSKPRIWPKIRRPVWTCVIAAACAVPIWACYRTPLRSIVFLDKMPVMASNAPVPPDLHYPTNPAKNPSTISSATPIRDGPQKNKPTANISPQPTQSVQQANSNPQALRQTPTQPAPDSQAECPEAGKLVTEWYMIVGPVANGGYRLNFDLDPSVLKTLSPFLRPLMGPGPKRLLNPSQQKAAIDLSEEIRSHLPKPKPIPITQQASITPELTLQVIRRNFLLDGNYLQFEYSSETPNGMSLPYVKDKVLITNLSASAQHTLSEFDDLVKAWGDASCKDAMGRLIKQQ
jgi:hypothetical protein